MNYFILFEGKTTFNKLWLLLDLRAESDLRLTNSFFEPYKKGPLKRGRKSCIAKRYVGTCIYVTEG